MLPLAVVLCSDPYYVSGQSIDAPMCPLLLDIRPVVRAAAKFTARDRFCTQGFLIGFSSQRNI